MVNPLRRLQDLLAIAIRAHLVPCLNVIWDRPRNSLNIKMNKMTLAPKHSDDRQIKYHLDGRFHAALCAQENLQKCFPLPHQSKCDTAP